MTPPRDFFRVCSPSEPGAQRIGGEWYCFHDIDCLSGLLLHLRANEDLQHAFDELENESKSLSDYEDLEYELEAAKRRIESLEEDLVRNAWRPIEDAPSNESVLIFIPNAEHYGVGIYRAILVNMGTGSRWMTSGLHHGSDLTEDNQPTHWRPLPEPP